MTMFDSKIEGINIAGYFTSESGVGAAARGYARAIKNLGLNVALNNIDITKISGNGDVAKNVFAKNNPYPVNVICVNADHLSLFVEEKGPEYFESKYNVGVWWWELPQFPQESWKQFAHFDELWVGSSFIQQAIAANSPIPVVVIPPALSVETNQKFSKESFGLLSDECTFLFCFDYLSGFERKNPLAVIRAFKQAFENSDRVRLVLKTINSDKSTEQSQNLIEAAGDAKITFIDKKFSPEETLGLISVCDCYVSLHRSEGLGLMMAESMLLRKPVIATGWSGNMDFMSVSNSYPVSYQLIVKDKQDGPYKIGEVWAEPDVEEASAYMRAIYEDPLLTKAELDRAFLDISGRYSESAVASLIKTRIICWENFKMDTSNVSTKNSGKEAFLDQYSSKQIQSLESWSSTNSAMKLQSANPLVFLKNLLSRWVTLGYRQADFNAVCADLLRRALIIVEESKAKAETIDSRLRQSLSENDQRIRMLEKKIADLEKDDSCLKK